MLTRPGSSLFAAVPLSACRKISKKREGKAAIGFRAAGEERVAVFKKARACEITNKDLEKYGIIPELAGRLPVKAVLNTWCKNEL